MRGSETRVPMTTLLSPSRALSCEATWGSSEAGRRGRTMWESSDPGRGGGAFPRSPPLPAKDARRGGVTASQHSDHWTQRFSARPWELLGQEGP